MRINKRGVALFVASLMVTSAAYAEEVEKDGVIVSRTDHGVNIRTPDGPLHVVKGEGFEVREDRTIGSRASDVKKLIPGLIVKVEGELQGDTITAHRIIYKDRDWRSAIAATGATTEQFASAAAERAELRQAIIDGQEYVVQQEATVYFPVGSSAVGSQYKNELRALAQKAPSYGNYRVSVIGYADPTGDADANERLSLKRAIAVSNYMRQTGAIQPGRVLSPTAMGEGALTPGEAAPANNDQARRVVVRVVTPKGQLQN